MKSILVIMLFTLSFHTFADSSFMNVSAKNMDDLVDDFKEKLDEQDKGINILLHWDFEKSGGSQEFGFNKKDGRCHNKTTKVRDIIYYDNKLKNWFQFAPDKTYGTVHLTCESSFKPRVGQTHPCGTSLETHGKNQKCYVDQHLSTFTQLGNVFFDDNIAKGYDPNIQNIDRSESRDNKLESSPSSTHSGRADVIEE